MGLDADDFSIDGYLGNNVSSANIHLDTTGDRYMPGVVTLATDEGPPVNTAAPTISGTPSEGQTLTANHRHLERHADADLRLPVASLQRRRRQLRRHRGRHGIDLRADRRPTSARRSASS